MGGSLDPFTACSCFFGKLYGKPAIGFNYCRLSDRIYYSLDQLQLSKRCQGVFKGAGKEENGK